MGERLRNIEVAKFLEEQKEKDGNKIKLEEVSKLEHSETGKEGSQASLPSGEDEENIVEKERIPEINRFLPERPERGFRLWLWRLTERILQIDKRREILRKILIEKVESEKPIESVLLIIEIAIRRLTKNFFVPIIRLFMGKYREAFNAFVHNAMRPNSHPVVQKSIE